SQLGAGDGQVLVVGTHGQGERRVTGSCVDFGKLLGQVPGGTQRADAVDAGDVYDGASVKLVPSNVGDIGVLRLLVVGGRAVAIPAGLVFDPPSIVLPDHGQNRIAGEEIVGNGS